MGAQHSASNDKVRTSIDGGEERITFDDFHILRAIGKGSFGKVSAGHTYSSSSWLCRWSRVPNESCFDRAPRS